MSTMRESQQESRLWDFMLWLLICISGNTGCLFIVGLGGYAIYWDTQSQVYEATPSNGIYGYALSDPEDRIYTPRFPSDAQSEVTIFACIPFEYQGEKASLASPVEVALKSLCIRDTFTLTVSGAISESFSGKDIAWVYLQSTSPFSVTMAPNTSSSGPILGLIVVCVGIICLYRFNKAWLF